jgi:hypothetical protein
MFAKKCLDFPSCPVVAALSVLILDEISMISGEFFDAFDTTCRELRGYSYNGQAPNCDGKQPFGGLQLVVVGDFFQLPPIPKAMPWPGSDSTGQHNAIVYDRIARDSPKATTDNEVSTPLHRSRPSQSHPHILLQIRVRMSDGREIVQLQYRGYAFESSSWWDACFLFIELVTVYRQADVVFVGHLNCIREEREEHLRSAVEFFNHRRMEGSGGDGADCLHMYATNAKADERNSSYLGNLPQPPFQFAAEDFPEVFLDETPNQVRREHVCAELMKDKFFGDCLATHTVDLKVGARVMLLQNLDLAPADGKQKLVNGSQGVRMCANVLSAPVKITMQKLNTGDYPMVDEARSRD